MIPPFHFRASLHRSRVPAVVAWAAFLVLAQIGQAQVVVAPEKEWDGSSSTTWSTNQNWTSVPRPKNNEGALFDTLGVARTSAELTSDDQIAGIRFGTGATVSYNISDDNGARTLTLGTAAPYVLQESAQDQTISVGRLALSASSVMEVTGAGNLTISSAIYSSASLSKDGSGAGKLILSGDNSNLTGNVLINSGVLQAAHTNALGTGSVTVANGAALELSGGVAPGNAAAVTGSGLGGTGAIRSVAGANTLSGTITQTGATTFGADAGSTLNLTGNLTGTNTATTFVGAGNINVAQVTTGTAGVTLNGSGTVTFNGASANTYTGTTTVNSGTLVLAKTAGATAIAGNLIVGDGTGTDTVRLDAANQIGDTATVTVNNGGLFNLNGHAETIGGLSAASSGATVSLGAGALTVSSAANSSYAGTISGTGVLGKSGTGQLVLTGNNSYSGGTNLQGGNITAGSNSALGTGTISVGSGGNLELQGGVTLANNFSLSSSGTGANDGAIESLAGTGTITGTVTLTGASRLQAGTGSTLNVNGGVALGSHTLTVGGAGNFSVSGAIAGTGGLAKDGGGTATLAGASTYTGATDIIGGTLLLAASERLADVTAVTIGAGATFDLAGHTETVGSIAGDGSILIGTGQLIAGGDNTDTSFGGTITGLGGLTKTGTGTLVVTSNLGFAGDLVLAAGTLQFDLGNAFNDVTLSGGTLRLADADLSIGSLHVTGNTTIDFAGAGSMLDVTSLTIDADVVLTIINWQDAADFFYAQNFAGAVQNIRGQPPLDRIVFNPPAFGGNDTIWLPYNDQITPVPEPSTYGAILMGAGLALFGWRRWRQARAAGA